MSYIVTKRQEKDEEEKLLRAVQIIMQTYRNAQIVHQYCNFEKVFEGK